MVGCWVFVFLISPAIALVTCRMVVVTSGGSCPSTIWASMDGQIYEARLNKSIRNC